MSRLLRFPHRIIEELRETERQLVVDLEGVRARIAEAEGLRDRSWFPRCTCALCIVERSRGGRP